MKNALLILNLLFALSTHGQSIGPEDRIFRIFFGGGSYFIDHQQISDLEDFINEIEDFREYEVEIHGHTDNIGSLEYNQYLSQMRCRAAFYEMVKLDIPKDLITIHDFGELSPLYDNQTWDGRLSNRRVDIVFKKILQ